MKLKKHTTAFVTGELSPDLKSREESQLFEYGLEAARNVYILPQGGAKRREGLRHIGLVRENAKARLISFEFNTEQVYLLVLSAGALQVWRNNLLMTTLTGGVIGGITEDMIDSVTWTQSQDTLILFHSALQPIRITRSSHTAWTATAVTFTNIPNYDYGSGNEPVMSVARGWPKTGVFFGGRLILGGLGSRPATLLMSKVGDYYNLSTVSSNDDDGINFTLDDGQVNGILHIFSGQNLQIFTTGGEYWADTGVGSPLTPKQIATQLRRASQHGSNGTRPISMDGVTLFVQGAGAVVRQYVYNDVDRTYNAFNVSNRASHLIRNPLRVGVRRATREQANDATYFVNDDGTVAVLGMIRDDKFLAWSLFETDGLVEDVAVVANQVYFVVARQANNGLSRRIEQLDAGYLTDGALKLQGQNGANSFRFPSMLMFGVPVQASAWSGLGHLAGRTVSVIGDEAILDDAVVDAFGQVELTQPVSFLEVGLPFYARIKTMPAVVQFTGQDWAGKFKRLVAVSMRLAASRGVVVRQIDGESYSPAWRHFGVGQLGIPVPLYTGWKKVLLGGFSRDAQVEITQEYPLEFYVLSLNMEVGV